MINKDLWNTLSVDQQNAITKASEDSLSKSWESSSSVECETLQKILDFNDGQVQLNPDGTEKDCDLGTPGVQTCSADMVLAAFPDKAISDLQAGSAEFLESLKGNSADQVDYEFILNAVLDYESRAQFVWKPQNFPTDCPFNIPSSPPPPPLMREMPRLSQLPPRLLQPSCCSLSWCRWARHAALSQKQHHHDACIILSWPGPFFGNQSEQLLEGRTLPLCCMCFLG